MKRIITPISKKLQKQLNVKSRKEPGKLNTMKNITGLFEPNYSKEFWKNIEKHTKKNSL